MEDDRYNQEPPRSEPDPYRLEEERRNQELYRLQAEERRHAVFRRNLMARRAMSVVYYLIGALLILLLIRFFLRLTAANPQNTFAQFIGSLSEPFVAPFSTLFVSPTFAGGAAVFDINLLVAIAVYTLLGMLAVWLIQVIGISDEVE